MIDAYLCLVLSFLSCLVLPCFVLSCLVLSCRVVSCLVLFRMQGRSAKGRRRSSGASPSSAPSTPLSRSAPVPPLRGGTIAPRRGDFLRMHCLVLSCHILACLAFAFAFAFLPFPLPLLLLLCLCVGF